MKLSEESLDSLRQRLDVARLNSNPGVVNRLVETCRTKVADPDVVNALALLGSFAAVIHTLSNDIDYLLQDRSHVQALLEVYEELEKYV